MDRLKFAETLQYQKSCTARQKRYDLSNWQLNGIACASNWLSKLRSAPNFQQTARQRMTHEPNTRQQTTKLIIVIKVFTSLSF